MTTSLGRSYNGLADVTATRAVLGGDNRRDAVPVRTHTINRVGLLQDIARVRSVAGITIVQTSQHAQPDGTAQCLLTVETTGMEQRSRVLARIESVPGVTTAARSAEVPASYPADARPGPGHIRRQGRGAAQASAISVCRRRCAPCAAQRSCARTGP